MAEQVLFKVRNIRTGKDKPSEAGRIINLDGQADTWLAIQGVIENYRAYIKLQDNYNGPDEAHKFFPAVVAVKVPVTATCDCCNGTGMMNAYVESGIYG